MSKRRPNGDGTVRKRTDGRWEARIIVGHKENKKPIYKSVFGLTQAEAMAKFRKLQEVYQGVELTEDSIVTLNEWLDRWLALKFLNKTYSSGNCSARRIFDRISSAPR